MFNPAKTSKALTQVTSDDEAVDRNVDLVRSIADRNGISKKLIDYYNRILTPQ